MPVSSGRQAWRGLDRTRPTELLAYLPIVERVGSRTIRYTGGNIEVSNFLVFAVNYEPGLQP